MGKLTHTVKGPIASFRSADKAPIESLKLHFLPKQEGSGDPSPTNIRPITGWTGCNVYKTGKNMCHVVGYSAHAVANPSATRGLANSYGTTISTVSYENSDGKVVITQSECGSPDIPQSYKNGYVCVVVNGLMLNRNYTVSFKVTDIASNPLNVNRSSIKVCGPTGGQHSVSEIIGDTIIFKNVSFNRNVNQPNQTLFDIRICGLSFTLSEFMVKPVGDSDGIFEPYSGETISISWSDHGVEYGGYVDLIRGKLVAEYEMLTDTWGNWGTAYDVGDGTTLRYKKFSNPVYGNGITNHHTDYCNVVKYNYSNENGNPHYYIVASSYNCRVYLPNDFSTDQVIQVIGKLITPIEYDLTPLELKAFLDHNNFWSDMNDDTEVEYCFTDHFMKERKRICTSDFNEYIRNGLVLWMDGIDKGDVQNAWVDKINGHIFESINGMTVGKDHIQLSKNSSQYLENTTFDNAVDFQEGTIEVVISDYTIYSAIIFAPNIRRGLCFGFGSSGSILYCISAQNDDRANHYIIPNRNTGKCFSISSDIALIDGELVSPSSSMSYFGQNYPTDSHIGGRIYTVNGSPSPNYFNGKIYSIRLYNRKLSKSEMLYNQYVDNKRFNLGISVLK